MKTRLLIIVVIAIIASSAGAFITWMEYGSVCNKPVIDHLQKYSNSRVIVFLDDIQVRVTSQMPLEQILKIAESMTTDNQNEVQNPYIRILDESFNQQSLQTGKSIEDPNFSLRWFGLTMSLFIVSAYIIMKIKRRKSK